MDKLEIKASIVIDEAGTITGNAWPFDTPDAVGDIVLKGAINVAVADLPMLLSHDAEQPIGVWDEVRQTPEGLQVKGKLFVEESQRARAVRGLIQGGQLTGLSIGFRSIEAKQRGRNRVISKLDLFEISVVKNPSHPRARISDAKNATAALAEALTRAAVALRSN